MHLCLYNTSNPWQQRKKSDLDKALVGGHLSQARPTARSAAHRPPAIVAGGWLRTDERAH